MAEHKEQGEKEVVSVQGSRCEPDTRSWYEYQWKERQETPGRLEEAAKFVSGTMAVCLTLFLAAGKSQWENIGASSGRLKTAVILLLLGLLVTILVLFPWRYRYSGVSIEDFKRAHGRIILVKRVLLIAGLFLFLVSLAIMADLFFR